MIKVYFSAQAYSFKQFLGISDGQIRGQFKEKTKQNTEIFKHKNSARMRSLAMYPKYGIDLK